MRPYWYWLLGSPVGFLLVLGLPIAWLRAARAARGADEAVAIFAVLAIAAVMGFTKAETERIWLFFAPFVCLAAARGLARRPELPPVAAALAAQALLHEACRTPSGERSAAAAGSPRPSTSPRHASPGRARARARRRR